VTRAAALALVLLAGCLDAPPEATEKAFDAAPIDAAGLDPSLVLWYPMDVPPQEGVVTDDALDHDAECGDCPVVVDGHDGSGALDFEGTDSLSVEDGDRLRTDAGTWAMWTRFDDVGFDVMMARPIGDQLEDDVVFFVSGGLVSFESGPGEHIETAGPVSPGLWVHIAATWTQQEHSIYVDGILAATGVASAFEYQSVELLIGADRDNGELGLFFDGALDDLRIYDRALTEAEIAALAGRPTAAR